MTTFAPTFTGNRDRARVLTEILREGPAVSGVTLIALIDRTTHEVLSVRSMPTPEAVLDADGYFDGVRRSRLSGILHDVAKDLAPDRRWTGERWSAMTSELITVVCRGGEAEITPTEVQFYWGWRYSNHLTEALDGDVYVVTPQGWANLLPEFSGSAPALPAAAHALDTQPEVQEAERVLADASLALLGPEPRECLVCYVHRMLVEFGCDCRLRFAAHYRDVRAPRATGLERRLGRMGGYCDCEILFNGYELRPQYWVPEAAAVRDELDEDEDDDQEERTWPKPLHACRGVRAGSTQPCVLWCRLRRW